MYITPLCIMNITPLNILIKCRFLKQIPKIPLRFVVNCVATFKTQSTTNLIEYINMSRALGKRGVMHVR